MEVSHPKRDASRLEAPRPKQDASRLEGLVALFHLTMMTTEVRQHFLGPFLACCACCLVVGVEGAWGQAGHARRKFAPGGSRGMGVEGMKALLAWMTAS